MLYTQFVHALTAAMGKMPRAEWRSIKDAGMARVVARQQAGRADGPLLFNDLIERIETALMPS